MAKRINNMDELQIALLPVMKDMVDEMAERVYQTLNYFLKMYYDSYDPIYYRRQFDFLRSAVKVKPRKVGNKITAAVYIDYHSMDHYYEVSGYQVASWANQGLHGGQKLGTNTPLVWDDMIKNTVSNSDLLKLAVDYLRKQGFTVVEQR